MPTGPVVVEWPAAQDSQVLAVRLVSTGEKFSGRAVRMALAAEGFVLGKFAIFHKAAPDGRALLSIASLNKPGTFDLQSIDLQRYGGLNLFTVTSRSRCPQRLPSRSCWRVRRCSRSACARHCRMRPGNP